MGRILLVGLALILVQSGRAARAEVRPGEEYLGVFWYDRARPVASLKYQLYDLRKGEHDKPTVDRWLELLRAQYPGHGTYVREIRAGGEPGATEAERLGRAIEREKRRWAEVNRRPLDQVPRLIENPAASYRSGPRPVRGLAPGRGTIDRPSPGSPGVFTNQPGSPFPYPYRAGPR